MRYDDDTHEARLHALETRLADVEAQLRRLSAGAAAATIPTAPAAPAPPPPAPAPPAPVVPPPPPPPPAPATPPPPVPPRPAAPQTPRWDAPKERDLAGFRLPPPPAPAAAPTPARAARITLPERPQIDLEQLLGGRLLAWIGGVAILVGIAFFVATAMQRGWIPPSVRIALSFVGSAALLGLGVWLHERKGQTQASLAAIGTAIAALYASLVGATSLYHLIPTALALAVALLVGAIATGIAVRLESVQVAGLGILGALVAPVTVDAGKGWAALIFMGIALASSTGVLVWQRWDWLALLAYVASAPQLAVWMLDDPGSHVVLGLVALVVFWAIYVVAALGYELRVPTAELRASSALLAVSNVIFTTGLGWLLLDRTHHDTAATAWVIAMAGVHVAGGAVASLRMREGREIPLLLVACGVSLSAIGLALALDGPWLVAGWAVEGALLAWISRRLDSVRALLGSLAFVVLAAAIALHVAVPGMDEYASTLHWQNRVAALLIVAVSAAVSAYFYRDNQWEPLIPEVLEVGAALFALGAVPIVLGGSWLVAGLAAGATVLAAIAGRWDRRSAALGAAAWASVALVLAVRIGVPRHGYTSDVDLWPRLAALLVVAAAALASAYLVRRTRWTIEPLEAVAAALVLVALPIAFDGVWLVVALSIGVTGLAAIAGRWSHRVAFAAAGVWLAVGLSLALHLGVFVDGYATSVGWETRIPALLAVAAAVAATAALVRRSPWSTQATPGLESLAAVLVLLTLPIALDGVWLVTALAAGAVIFAAAAARWTHVVALGAAGAWAAVAAVLALRIAVPEGVVYASGTDWEIRAAALLVLAAAALAAAFVLRTSVWRDVVTGPLEAAAAGLVLASLPIALDGTALVAAVAVGGVALAAVARQFGHRVAGAAAWVWSVGALAHVLLYEAPPRQALLEGVAASHALALALATASVVATVVLSWNTLGLADEHRMPLGFAAGIVLLYGLSGLVVAAVPRVGGGTDGKSLALSAFWSLVGAGLFVAGLSRDKKPVRLGALALLALAIAKVFLHDLASLGSLTRVASFIVLGILLLAAAYAYQRHAANR